MKLFERELSELLSDDDSSVPTSEKLDGRLSQLIEILPKVNILKSLTIYSSSIFHLLCVIRFHMYCFMSVAFSLNTGSGFTYL